jgi:hypothetical protein
MRNKKVENYTVGFVEANLKALLAAGPFCVVFILSYAFLYGWSALSVGSDVLIESGWIWLLVFTGGILMHELLHAVSWAWLDDIPCKNIHFGFMWTTITPYVHCSVPVTARSYRWGTAMPGIVLGIFPCLLALIFQSVWMFYFGLVFTLAAGGDFLILWLLRNVEAKTLVRDHPDRIGCQVVNYNER